MRTAEQIKQQYNITQTEIDYLHSVWFVRSIKLDEISEQLGEMLGRRMSRDLIYKFRTRGVFGKLPNRNIALRNSRRWPDQCEVRLAYSMWEDGKSKNEIAAKLKVGPHVLFRWQCDGHIILDRSKKGVNLLRKVEPVQADETQCTVKIYYST